MQTMYDEGVRIFLEVGPKRVLNALATDNFKRKKLDVTILATNHRRKGAISSINEALCGLFAAGVGVPAIPLEDQPEKLTKSMQTVDVESVKAFVFNLIGEKTGHPPEMLDAELDLEADLGIDTVKQAEIFASIRSHYQISCREELRLPQITTQCPR